VSQYAVSLERVTKCFVLAHERARSIKEVVIDGLRWRPRVRREPLVALDDVTFDVSHGGALGIVGPNGMGKSTTLKLVARILAPTSGRVTVHGQVASLLELGAGFHPELSGRDNILLNGSIMGMGRQAMRSRLEQIVDFSEIEKFIDTPVKHYSSGMNMRLGFATAVHLDAEILLFDEVLSVGDHAFQAKCRDRIGELKRDGATILFVSHDPGAVKELCDQVHWLEHGKIVATGEPDEVLELYQRTADERHAARRRGNQPEPARVSHGGDEIEIISVDILGAAGDVAPMIRTGDPMSVVIHYQAHTEVRDPVFGIAIHREDGLPLSESSTRDAAMELGVVHGRGKIRVNIPRLPLMEGSYELSASCHNSTLTRHIDHHPRRYPLQVQSGAAGERSRLVSLDPAWVHEARPSRLST